MEQAFKPRRLSDTPWTEDITLVVGSAHGGLTPTSSVAVLDRISRDCGPGETLIILGSWADGEIGGLRNFTPHARLYPKARDGDFHGGGTWAWVSSDSFHHRVRFSPAHPLYPHFRQYQIRDTWTGEIIEHPPPSNPAWRLVQTISPASSEFRNLIVEQLKPVWEEYGVDGFFIDATQYVINDGNGLIDGLNMAQGMALLHKELAEAMPGIVLGGERLHEASFAYESFAQRPLIRWEQLRPHPISTFLFSPFVHAIGYAPQAPVEDPVYNDEFLRVSKIWDIIPTAIIWGPEHLGEQFVEMNKYLEAARVWQPEYGLNGDVNGDGIINILDLTLVGQNFDVPFAHLQADVDGDGQVNVLDLIIIANMLEDGIAIK